MSIFANKTLMITGGTGSFGNAVLNRFLDTDIGEIRIFSRDEKKQDDMRHHLQAQNLETAKKLVTKKYVIFFHDDDIMHPQYLEYILKLLNLYPDVNLICSLLKVFYNKSDISIKTIKKLRYRVFRNKKNFIEHIYSAFFTDGTSLMFPNIVYNSAFLEKFILERDKYGRPCDKPAVCNFLHDGKCIQMLEKMLFYRIHSAQETQQKANDPNLIQIANYLLYFKNVLSESLLSKLVFEMFSIKWAKFLYIWGNLSCELSYFKFLKILYEKKVINLISIFFNLLHIKKILKPFTYLQKLALTKSI